MVIFVRVWVLVGRNRVSIVMVFFLPKNYLKKTAINKNELFLLNEYLYLNFGHKQFVLMCGESV